jgi:hypothetical protein
MSRLRLALDCTWTSVTSFRSVATRIFFRHHDPGQSWSYGTASACGTGDRPDLCAGEPGCGAAGLWGLNRIYGSGLTALQCVYGIHLVACPKKRAGRFAHRTCASNFRVNVISRVAGFRPGRRGPFLSGKGPKTIDAPSGLIEGEDAILWRADQLTEPVLSVVEGLKHGPPPDEGEC